MKTCQICKRKYKGVSCWIFYIYDKQDHPFKIQGKNIIACKECNLNYLSQYFKFTNKDLEDWLEWITTDPVFKS